jgi:RimJ/RimL family protein N-acetyltransferase
MKICNYGIYLKLAEIEDAEFILSLRNDPELNRFISSTSSNLNDQKTWIEKYKGREEKKTEYYFIACDKSGHKWGTTRLYDFKGDRFEFGSWLFRRDAPFGLSIKADILTREIAFNELLFEFCTLTVRKANFNVINYHKGYNPRIINDDDLNYYYEVSKNNFIQHSRQILNLFGENS